MLKIFYPFNVAMNKLVFHEEASMLYSFGGFGSSGQNFKLKLGKESLIEGEDWQEFERKHTAIVTATNQSLQGTNAHDDIELVHFPTVYFG